ncbi:MAG: hypothetical protein U0L18_07210 [Acutalibacteraceae bacterium]|nr:hypothetical protein [Acutalibacteraceae bacterium]
MKYEIGKERHYNEYYGKVEEKPVVRWEVLDVAKEQEIYLEFVSTNSKYKQGIRLAIDTGKGYIEIDGEQYKGVRLWEDTCPKSIKFRCVSSEGKLSIYNIFDMGPERGGVHSLVDSSGMLVEEIDGYIVYRCNDVEFDGDFDRLEFRIKLL